MMLRMLAITHARFYPDAIPFDGVRRLRRRASLPGQLEVRA
jgi:hypothetical protein